VRQTRIRKRRPRPVSRRQEPLRLDARDPDIIKAHQLARKSRLAGTANGSPGRDHQDPAGPRQTGEHQALRLVTRAD
jgi:hypothetical protein